MVQEKLTNLSDRVAGYVDRVIAPNLSDIRLVERLRVSDPIRIENYLPYKRYYSFHLPEEPLSGQSVLQARISLYVSDLELLAGQNYGKCMDELQNRIAGYKSEMDALEQKGYAGSCNYVDDPLFETTYRINTASEMHIRTVLTDFLTTMKPRKSE